MPRAGPQRFPGSAIDIVENEATTNACTLVEGGTTLGLNTAQIGPPSGKVQLSTQAISGSFAYLFVVETSP